MSLFAAQFLSGYSILSSCSVFSSTRVGLLIRTEYNSIRFIQTFDTFTSSPIYPSIYMSVRSLLIKGINS